MPPLRELLLGLLGARRLLGLLGLYPPYLGAGVRVTHVGADLRSLEVELRLTPWNRNYFGTHFGGSLYAMVDPFYALLLMQHLPAGWAVWDKAAAIRFVRPGRGTVRARFALTSRRIEEIRREVQARGTAEPVFDVQVVDAAGALVASVEKRLHVRREGPAPARAGSRRPGPRGRRQGAGP